MNSRLTIFSDCDYFAGCENVISVMLNSNVINSKYEMSFIYRFSKQYEIGLLNRVEKTNNLKRLYLLVLNRSTLPTFLRNIFFFRSIWRALSLLFLPLLISLNTLNIFLMLCATLKKDILYVNNGGYPASKNALLCILFGRLLRFNHIILSCNNVPAARSAFPPLYFLQRFMDLIIDSCVNIILVGSEFNKSNLVNYRDFTSSKVLVIPNGIDTNRFNSKEVLKSRAKTYSQDSEIKFGMIGLHEQRKGHLFLLSAVRDIVEEGYTEFKIVIEGNGNLTQRFKDFVRLNSLGGIVEFVTPEDISSVYSAIDLLLVPSLHSEDLPNVISEAMFFGVPAIGSNLAGIPSQITHDENGLIFEVGDADDLKACIKKILDNKYLLSRYKQSCISTFKSKFSSDIYLYNLEEILGAANE